jgi:hypothetical protein
MTTFTQKFEIALNGIYENNFLLSALFYNYNKLLYVYQ